MTQRIHLSIVQPPGYVHSLGFLDQARFARYQFRQWGAEVTLGKNRLREDAINIIFGAHLGFSAQLKERFTCVFFNLEQLGEGGASVDPAYIDLLRSSAVIDYDVRNLAAYGCQEGDVPVVSFEYAPYLNGTPTLPIENRPIDLLFFGSVNERRQAIFKRIEACGWKVSSFDHPLYGDERDHFIRQSKAVFNCHFYESSRFEQARAFHTLSLGTPVISERTDRTTPPPAYEAAVSWVSDKDLETFFASEFMTPNWLARAQQQLQVFSQNAPVQSWETTHTYCQALWRMDGDAKAAQIWRPARMNLGSGHDYKPGLLNVDFSTHGHPDLQLDFNQAITFPLSATTLSGARVVLEASSMDTIFANQVMARGPNVSHLISNLFHLLQENGRIELEIIAPEPVRYPVPTTEASAHGLDMLRPFTVCFWEMGWFHHRFEIEDVRPVDPSARTSQSAGAVRVRMKKVATTLREKTAARVMMADFSVVPHDMDGSLTI